MYFSNILRAIAPIVGMPFILTVQQHSLLYQVVKRQFFEHVGSNAFFIPIHVIDSVCYAIRVLGKLPWQCYIN